MVEIYDELGIRPIISCAGRRTAFGGSRMDPEVLRAMAEASQNPVPLDELNRAIGAYIAQVTGADAAMVTSGASSAMVLSVAACMTGRDGARVRQLPDPSGMPDQLVIQKIHRSRYSHVYTFAGAKFTEVGNVNECDATDVTFALNERTAAIAYLERRGLVQVGLTLREMTEVAHAHNLPLILDAASTLPPRSNLRRFLQDGADLVAFSGGKFINGPSSTGFLCGRGDLIEAALANASPNHAIGRPHKVSREDMVGLYVALKRFMSLDEDVMLDSLRKRLEPIAAQLSVVDGLYASVMQDDDRFHVPSLVLRFGAEWKGPDGNEIADRLFRGEPRIYLPWERERKQFTVDPVNLRDDEAVIVGERLLVELGQQTSR